MEEFHDNTIKLLQDMKCERDIEKSKSAVQRNEFLKTREALQVALSSSRSEHQERCISENALKTEVDHWKIQSKVQDDEHRKAEKCLQEEIQRLNETCKEEHFAAVRAQAEYASALQKAQTDHACELARANAEIISLKELLGTVTRQRDAGNSEMERLVAEHLADERGITVRHKTQLEDLQRHIDGLLWTHQKDMQELREQSNEAQKKLVHDHQRHLHEQEESTKKALQQENRSVKTTLLKEQQQQHLVLKEMEGHLLHLQQTLQHANRATSSFRRRQESSAIAEAHSQKSREHRMLEQELAIGQREVTGREAEVQRLVAQLRRSEEEAQRSRAKGDALEAECARLKVEVEKREIELSRQHTELVACRTGRDEEESSRVEREAEVLGRSLALSRELVLKERELKGVEGRLRESEAGAERLERELAGKEREVESAKKLLEGMEVGEVLGLQCEVEELRQKLADKEKEVQHWQGEGMAAEDGMGQAIRALQESKVRVEAEVEERRKAQGEVDAVRAACHSLKSELESAQRTQNQWQQEAEEADAALESFRQRLASKQRDLRDRRSASLALERWAGTACARGGKAALQGLSAQIANRVQADYWGAWVHAWLQADRGRVAAQRVMERKSGRVAAQCYDRWQSYSLWAARLRVVCGNVQERKQRAMHAAAWGKWERWVSRRRWEARLLSGPPKAMTRAWRSWKRSARGSRTKAALRSQAARCVRILRHNALSAAWKAWAGIVNAWRCVAEPQGRRLVERGGPAKALVVYGRISATCRNVMNAWLSRVHARRAASARVEMMRRRFVWRRESDAWSRWETAVWFARQRARWAWAVASSRSSAGLRKVALSQWKTWCVAVQLTNLDAAADRRGSRKYLQMKLRGWREASCVAAISRLGEARAERRGRHGCMRQALRVWAGEWRWRRKTSHGAALIEWRRRRENSRGLWRLWASAAGAAGKERQREAARRRSEQLAEERAALQRAAIEREQGWEVVEPRLLRELRRLEGAARGMKQELSGFPTAQVEEAVERARRAEEAAAEESRRLAEALACEQVAREEEKARAEAAREEWARLERKLRLERDESEGYLAALKVGCEEAVERIEQEKRKQVDSLAARAAAAEAAETRTRQRLEGTVRGLQRRLRGQQRVLVRVAQARANADCAEGLSPPGGENLAASLSGSGQLAATAGAGDAAGWTHRPENLDRFLAQVVAGAGGASERQPWEETGEDSEAGDMVVDRLSALGRVEEEEEEIFASAMGDGEQTDGVRGLSDALRALERNRAEVERERARLRTALVSNKELSIKNRELALELEAIQSHPKPATGVTRASNPFDAEN